MSLLKFPFNRVDWITSAFLIGTGLIALVGAPWYIWNYGLDWFQIAMFLFYVAATAMGITLGYHRLFSHIAFKASWPVKLWNLIFGACAFQNSALDWCADHRTHHKHVDHDDDPYDISKGFFFAHIGWLLFKLRPDKNLDNVKDLMKDPLIMWQHKYVHLIAVVFGFVLPAALGYLWNGWVGALGGFLISGVTRVVVVQHSTFFINSLCHTVGRQPYSTNHSARDSVLMAFLTFGEGYHNYHHEFQHDYRNGVKPWQWDPTKWSIWLLSKFGLTHDLRRVPDEKILLAEMREAHRKAAARIRAIEQGQATVPDKAFTMMSELSANLTKNYYEAEKMVSEQVEHSKQKLADLQRETRRIMRDFASI